MVTAGAQAVSVGAAVCPEPGAVPPSQPPRSLERIQNPSWRWEQPKFPKVKPLAQVLLGQGRALLQLQICLIPSPGCLLMKGDRRSFLGLPSSLGCCVSLLTIPEAMSHSRGPFPEGLRLEGLPRVALCARKVSCSLLSSWGTQAAPSERPLCPPPP